jgi:putative transcriptional regulator
MKKQLFEDLMQSLNEAAEHAEGKRKNLRTTRFPQPPKTFSKNDIVRLRRKLNWSQMYLARGLNVSVKTVQAWEQGLRTPEGATLKLLEIAEKHPEVLVNS